MLRTGADPDAFPATDLGLRRALARLGAPPGHPGRWRPWRGYAAQHLWTWEAATAHADHLDHPAGSLPAPGGWQPGQAGVGRDGFLIHRHEEQSMPDTILATTLDTPIGPLSLLACAEQLIAGGFTADPAELHARLHPSLRGLARQAARPGDLPWLVKPVGDYFDGDLTALDGLATRQPGSAGRERLWAAMRAVPAGAVISYAALAARAGNPRAPRAAGAACAANLVAPVIPCHRIAAYRRQPGRLLLRPGPQGLAAASRGGTPGVAGSGRGAARRRPGPRRPARSPAAGTVPGTDARAPAHLDSSAVGRRSFVRKVLIANRGEIAVRVVRACRDAGLGSVAVYAEPDLDALHVSMADEAYALGGRSAADSYLNIEKILKVAADSGADAVHPGYGFLAENAGFAQAVTDAGLTWIGPPPAAIEALGDKVAARRDRQQRSARRWRRAPMARSAGQTRWTHSSRGTACRSRSRPRSAAAAAGSRWSASRPRSPRPYESAVREAVAAFGRGECFVERYLDRPRHVETQCLADARGNVVVVSTRDCSLQRRHQKLVEEAPAPFLSAEPDRADVRRRPRRSCARPGTWAPGPASSWSARTAPCRSWR